MLKKLEKTLEYLNNISDFMDEFGHLEREQPGSGLSHKTLAENSSFSPEIAEKILPYLKKVEAKLNGVTTDLKIKLINKFSYLLQNQIDLTIALYHLKINMKSKNTLVTKFFCKTVGVICYEIFNDKGQITGPEINKICEEYGMTSDLSELNSELKQLGELKKDKIELLKGIRNQLFGHRNHHGNKQFKYMNSINEQEVLEIGFQIFRCQDLIARKMIELMQTV